MPVIVPIFGVFFIVLGTFIVVFRRRVAVWAQEKRRARGGRFAERNARNATPLTQGFAGAVMVVIGVMFLVRYFNS